MAGKTKPNSVLVTGLRVFVKDPNAAAGTYFTKWRRITGSASMTMPDEAPTTTDTPLIDGSISAVGFGGIGTIVMPIGALTSGLTHRFLAAFRRTKKSVLVRVGRPAVKVFDIDDAASVAAADAGESVITIKAANRTSVRNLALVDQFAAVAAADPAATGDANPTVAANGEALLDYTEDADDGKFMAIGEVAENGQTLNVVPGVSSAIAVGSEEHLWVRNPGIFWDSIECQVAQFGDSDWQAGGHAAGNLVLQPTSELPVHTPLLLTSVPAT